MTTRPTESLRLFYALWPDETTRAALTKLQLLTTGKLTDYQNLHITLAFLGQQPASMLPLFKDILEHVPAMPMMLTLDRVGYFTRSRIAWAGMHQVPDSLLALRQALVQQLARHGIEFDDRSEFKPHVTLARDSEQPPDLPFDAIPWHATHVALVQSKTQADGVRYEVIASRHLGSSV